MSAPALDQPLLPCLALADSAPRPRRVPVRAHLRRVHTEAPPTGKERKDAALIAHEAKQAIQPVIRYVREQLLALYASRVAQHPGAFVTADDVETILREWPACPDEAKREFGPQLWRGTVFRKGWRQTGQMVPSLRPHMNHTSLPAWRPVAAPSPVPTGHDA